MDREKLKNYLDSGLSTRKIAKLENMGKSNVGYWVNKHELTGYMKYKKPEYTDINYFKKIDTKEKAYILGFLLGDGCLEDHMISAQIALCDKEILDFLSSELGCNVQTTNRLDKKKRIFPSAGIFIGNKTIVTNLKMLFGGNKKEDRHIPIISPKLERYLLLGFFDAEGCITWGKRKDRNKLWQKITFTSQYKMLEGIQNILYKNDIASKLRPRKDCNSYNIEFSNKDAILKFLDLIYPNDEFIVLKRKFNNAQALRLELGEFGEA